MIIDDIIAKKDEYIMVYKKYGETFKKIRIQEGVPLSFFASVGISKSTLSDFENGKKMMSFDKVVVALQALNFSLQRFETQLNDYSICDSLDIIYEIREAVLLQETEKLEELYKKAELAGMDQIAITIRVILKKYTSDDIEELINFLYFASVWGFKELTIFYIIMDKISQKEIIEILTIFKNNSEGIYYSQEYNLSITLVLCNAIVILSSSHYLSEAQRLIEAIEKHKLASTMFLRTLLYGTKGIWTYHNGNTSKGIELINTALHIHQLAGLPGTYEYYKKIYNQYI